MGQREREREDVNNPAMVVRARHRAKSRNTSFVLGCAIADFKSLGRESNHSGKRASLGLWFQILAKWVSLRACAFSSSVRVFRVTERTGQAMYNGNRMTWKKGRKPTVKIVTNWASPNEGTLMWFRHIRARHVVRSISTVAPFPVKTSRPLIQKVSPLQWIHVINLGWGPNISKALK